MNQNSTGAENEIELLKQRIYELERQNNSLQLNYEQSYYAVIENAPVSVILVDSNGIIIKSEGKGTQSFLINKNIIGKNIFDEWEKVNFTKTTGKIYSSKEVFEKVLSGQIFKGSASLYNSFYKFKFIPTRNTGQIISGFMGIIVDATEAKKASDELRKKEKYFYSFIEHGIDLLSVIKQDGSIEYGSPSIKKILGYEFGELWNKSSFEFIHPDDRDKVVNAVNIIFSSEEPVNVSFRFKHKNGGWRTLEAVGRSIVGEDGVQLGIINSRDITEKILTEENLKNSEKLYRSLFETMLQGVIYMDQEGKIISVNPSACRILHTEKKCLIGVSPFEMEMKTIHEDGSDFPINEHPATIALIEGIEVQNKILGIKTPNLKEYIWLEVTAIPQFNGNNKKPFQVYTTINDVTERIEHQRQKRENDQLIKTIINNVPVVFFVIDQKGYFTFIEGKGLSGTRWEKNYLLGKSAFDYLDDVILTLRNNEKISLVQAFKRVLKGESIYGISKDYKSYFENHLMPVRDNFGNITHIMGLGSNITEKVSAEQALVESEERFSRLAESTDQIIWFIELESFKILYINPAFEKVWGYKVEEVLSDSNVWLNSIFEEDRHILVENYQDCISGRKTEFKSKYRIRTKSGEIKWIYDRGTGMKDSEGKIFRLSGITEDITDSVKAQKEINDYKNHLEDLILIRTSSLEEAKKQLEKQVKKQKLAEEKIKSQLSFLRTLINTIPLPVYIKDINKAYVDCNKAFENYFGISKENLRGKKVEDIFPDIAADLNILDDRMLTSPGRYVLQKQIKDSSGKFKEFIITKAPFFTHDGSLDGLVSVLMDVSEIKMLQNELEKALANEKELNELKSRFVSMASHEYRTPLTSIRIFTELLQIYGQSLDQKKFEEYLNKIQTSVDYMTDLVNDVLTISRAENGKLRFNPVEINLFDVCKRIAEEIEITLSPYQRLVWEYKMKERKILNDEKLLNQILSNLLSNAVKYSPKGKIEFIIDINASNIIFVVKDEGIGIPKAEQENIFNPFHRAENIKNIQGSGLGLAIVQKSLEMMGGSITLTSVEGEGSKFTVQIPKVI